MNIIEAEAARAAHWFGDHIHRTSAAQAAATTATGGTVSAVAEAKSILHDVLARLETVDEAAQSAIEAIRPNSTGVSIVNTLASIAHLPDPDGLLGGVDNMLKVAANVLAHAAQATAPADGSVQPAQATAAQPNVIR